MMEVDTDEMVRRLGRTIAPDEPLRLVRWGEARVVWAWQRPEGARWLLHTGQVVTVLATVPPWIIADSGVYRTQVGERRLALPLSQVLIFAHPTGPWRPALSGVYLTVKSVRVRCACGAENIATGTLSRILCRKCGKALNVLPATHRFREDERPAVNTVAAYGWQCPGCRKANLTPVIRESVRCPKCGGQFHILGARCPR